MTFVDTNVLLYAVSTAPEERAKAAVARAILDRTDLALSVQVLQEFFVQATRAGAAIRSREVRRRRCSNPGCDSTSRTSPCR